MGWNGSGGASASVKNDGGRGATRPTGGRGRSPSAPNGTKHKAQGTKHGIIAGLLVVAVGVVVVMLAGRRDPTPPKEPVKEKPKAIAEAKPAIAPKAEPVPEKPKRLSKLGSPIPDGVQPDERGVLRYPGGVRWLDPKRKVEKIENRPRVAKLFKHPVERHIAGLLEIEPGKMVFGTMMYPKSLNQDFINSLTDKIEITDEDTPEDIELKKAVEATKKELAERIKQGEDLIDILKGTREELARLGAYRNDLKAEIDKVVRDENYTEQDVKDFETAANQMLAKEGLPPIKVPNMMIRQRLMAREREKREREAAKQMNSEK